MHKSGEKDFCAKQQHHNQAMYYSMKCLSWSNKGPVPGI